jgi:hypothetical protein
MVDDFQVSSFESHTRILRNIGTRFGVPFVTVYSQDAKQQIEDLCDVYQGQILLATSSPTTRPRPYSPYGFKLYHGEEAAYVHASMPKKPWTVDSFHVRKVDFITDKVKELSEVEKKKHIASIGANKPEIMNTLRITEPYGAVLVELDRLKEANSQQLAVTYSLGASGDKIDQYWGLPFMLWLPEEMEPQSSMIDYQWNPRMLAALAIIAKATLGQGQIITDIIKKIAGGRGVLTEHDVLRAITHIYKKAGLITSKVCFRFRWRNFF